MAKKYAVSLSKGGVGKTCTAISIAAYFAKEKNQRVLIVDTDHNGNLRRYLGANPAEGLTDLAAKHLTTPPTTEEVLSYCEPIDGYENFKIISSEGAIERLDHHMLMNLSQIGRRWEDRKMGVELQLKRLLKPIENEFDYILVDNPPTIDLTMDLNVFFYVDELILPLQLESSSIDVLRESYLKKYAEIVSVQREVREENEIVKLRFVVPTFNQSRNIIAKETLLEIYNFVDLLNTQAKMQITVTNPVRRSTKVAQAVKKKKTIFDYAPESDVADDYRKVAEEIFNAN